MRKQTGYSITWSCVVRQDGELSKV